MTLIHDTLPLEADGIHPGSRDVAAWQQTHEPLLTVQVWLGPRDQVMLHTDWEASIVAATEPVCKPLEEMRRAVNAVIYNAVRLRAALEAVTAEREALLAAATKC